MADRSDDSNEKWYLKPIFTSFWNHYNQCNQYLEQNGHKMVQFSDEIDDIDDQNSAKCDSSLDNNKNFVEVESTADEDIDRYNQRMDALESIEESEFTHNRKAYEELVPFDDNEVVNISEEYLEFIMKTKRHQIERKKLREKRLRYNDRVEYVDISRFDSFSRKGVAPKSLDRIDGNRSHNKSERQQTNSAHDIRQQKMFEIYGEDYNVIQGMEAALQLNFDRLCDLYQPKFWPIMPIRITPQKQT